MGQIHLIDEDSDFASRTGTDYIPNDEETLEIRSILLKQQEKFGKLEADLVAVKAVYDGLLAQRSLLVNSIEGYKELISLPRRGQVPDDIFREIFLLCLPTEHDALMHQWETPMVFTQVCASWRNIALSTPALWSSIHIPVPPSTALISPYELPSPYYTYRSVASTVKRAELRIYAVQDWLDRTAGCPLSISLADSDAEASVGYAPRLIETILPFAGRLRSFSVSTTKRRMAQLGQVDVSDVPWLQELRIDSQKMASSEWASNAEGHPELSSTFWRNLKLFAAPSLRKLHLGHLDEDVARLLVTWSNLTSLHLNFNDTPTPLPQILKLLKRCTNLIEFYVSAAPSPLSYEEELLQDTAEESTEPMVLLCLRRFSVRHASPAPYPHVFDSLEFPALQELEYFISSRLVNPLRRFLHRHGHSLRKLHTDPDLYSEGGLVSCLKLCPNLQELVLRPSPVVRLMRNHSPRPSGQSLDGTNEFLKMLSQPDGDGDYLCPKLDSFVMACTARYTDDGIARFIKKKQAEDFGLSRLRLFACAFSRGQNLNVWGKLEQMEKEGLDLQLRYPTVLKNTSPGRSEQQWAREGVSTFIDSSFETGLISVLPSIAHT
ncbi:hypothetical protein CPB83DRAFT_859404 [Crepidotus variabilis]|uniref:F-box domain-containing protein n=1 Tax=Crepidotus variabilis TaxID=179855 RepID=A0A9P6EAQ5_9AGAR|nr:hypothetical protein CPB83DRAFT_859404 [Crepidotus variabilis]